MTDEIWRAVNIEEFNHYSISNKGRIKSKIRQGGGGILKNRLTTTGYYRTTLRNKDRNKSKFFLIHRLIALTFIDNPNNYPLVDHINRIRTDNRIENLRWCSHSTNSKNRTIKGCIQKKRPRKMKDGTITYYYFVYLQRKCRGFKTEEEAKNYLSKEISILNRTTK